MGLVGLLSGLAFGVLLSVAERGKTVLELTLTRATVWGVLGSAIYPLLTGRADQVVLTSALGALFATWVVGSARKGVRSGSARQSTIGKVRRWLLAFLRDALSANKVRGTTARQRLRTLL